MGERDSEETRCLGKDTTKSITSRFLLPQAHPAFQAWCGYGQPFLPSALAMLLFPGCCARFPAMGMLCQGEGGWGWCLNPSFSLDSAKLLLSIVSHCEGMATPDPAGSSQCPTHAGALAVPEASQGSQSAFRHAGKKENRGTLGSHEGTPQWYPNPTSPSPLMHIKKGGEKKN